MEKNPQNSNQDLESQFHTPANKYRMMPFWFWNHEMVEKVVQGQIQNHHDHGIGGEFLHPRHGRLTPYMGRRWMENVEAAADKCKELDMPCYLYDEDNWPSGPVGGKITGPYHPENRGKFLAIFDEDEFEAGKSIEYPIECANIAPETQFFAAIAMPATENYPDFSQVIDKVQDITSFVQDSVLKWNVPEGEDDWTVVFFCVLVNSYDAEMNGYIDILRKETVQEFIQETHQKYVDWFIERGKKNYLGTVVPGIFTDEPSMAHMQNPAGQMMKAIAFTPTMPARFQEMFGYPFTTALLSMFYETGKIATKHRCDIWECTTTMYVDAYYKQIYEFCDQYNWAHTGHVNGEGSFPSHFRQHGDYFRVFEYMHYGGIDQLTEECRADDIEEMWNISKRPYTGMAADTIISPKLGSSVAHLMNKPRVLVEAFGSAAWDITLASCKRVNDYLIATGCDLFVPHDFAYSEDGYRKGDHPASFYHQPYYKHWKRLADHSARLCALLNAESGVLNAEVLYLYPHLGFHAEMMPHTSNISELMGITFTHNADCLYRQQIDFEIAPEYLIMKGEFEDDHIKLNKQEFSIIFLNATTCITLKFAEFLQEFYNHGGKIIGTILLPMKSPDIGDNEKVAEIISYIFNIDPLKVYNDVKDNKIEDLKIFQHANKQGGRAFFLQAPNQDPYMGEYLPKMQQVFTEIFSSQPKNVSVWRDYSQKKHAAYIMGIEKQFGTNKDESLYFFTNTSKSIAYTNCVVEIACKPAKVELWDTLTGEVIEFKEYGIDGEKLILTLDFPLYQSYLFHVTKASEICQSKSSVRQIKLNQMDFPNEIPLNDSWQISLKDPNGAMLNTHWISQYEITSDKGWAYRSVRTFTHDFYLDGLDDIKTLKLVIEGLVGDYGWGKTTYDPLNGGDRAHFTIPHEVSVYVNEKKVSLKFDFEQEYLDPCWIVADIRKFVVAGKNTVKMECITRNHKTFHVVTDPWRLIGDFQLSEDELGIPHLSPIMDKIKLGDITQQGFAHFFGGFGYQQKITVPANSEWSMLLLEIGDSTDCIEVWLNGEMIKVCWNEWFVDLSKKAKPGENTLELVYYGIAQNMLQTNVFPQGIPANVSLKYRK